MEKLIKKCVCVLLMCASLIGITSCNNTNTGEPTGNDKTVEETTYPLMDYFENKVYAMKYASNDITCGTFRNDKFTAIGTTTMTNIINKGVYDFGKEYGGLCFTAKTGVEVESVTFTIITAKDCVLKGVVTGGYIAENGEIKGVSANVTDYYNNVTLSNGKTKAIYMKANEAITITVNTYRNDLNIDFGKVTSEFEKNATYKRMLIAFTPYKFAKGDELLSYNEVTSNTPYTTEELEALELGIRIYNVNFECKKIDE